MHLPKDKSQGSNPHKNAEIEAFIRSLNDAWLDGNYDELYAYFSQDCVLLPPDGIDAIVGADPIIDSYRQFGEMSTINEFSIENIETFTRSDMAVCHVCFEVDYEIDGQRYVERGLDVYVLSITGTYFQVVWRTQKNLTSN